MGNNPDKSLAHVRRLLDSYHRRVAYAPPELQRQLVEELVADVVSSLGAGRAIPTSEQIR